MIYPVTIVDNFFPDPDKIVELAYEAEYTNTIDGRWPGKRTMNIGSFNSSLFNWICRRLFQSHYETIPDYWEMDMTFQIVEPFHEDQYHIKNQGWVHNDYQCLYGGLIYLNKHPQKDTGTSIYTIKNGYCFQESVDTNVKESLYKGQNVLDEVYENAFNNVNGQFEESIRVNNVYNRMLLFDANTYHAAQTFGSNTDRLTLNFFLRNITGPQQPFVRQ